MNQDQEVRPVVWPTEEPQIPTKPERPAPTAPPPLREPTVELAQPEPAPAAQDLPEGVEEGSTHAYVWENAAAAAAVVRTIIHCDEPGPPEGPLAGMSARRVVAALMAGLGADVGGAVVEHLTDETDIRWLGSAVAEEPEVKHGTAMHALETLHQRIEAGDYLLDGGKALARQLLGRAFGASRSRSLMRQVQDETGFAVLKDVAPEQVAPFISHEHPQTIAILLSQLNPSQAAGILSKFPERLQADVSYRVATMGDITPAVLMEIEEALEASLRDILSGNQDVGGPKVTADMLNCSGSSVERNCLNHLDAQDAEVGEAVRNLMFTYHDIDKMTDGELGILLEMLDPKHLAICLKATGEGFKARLLGLLPEEARASVTAQMEQLGTMRRSEVEEVQLRVVGMVRQMEEQGKAVIVRGETDDTWV